MPIKDYFEIQKPIYTILKITPDTSIRNYNSANIAKSIQYMYKNITQRIHREEKKFIYETPVKCSFFIDIKKNDVNFYFVVPERYLGLIKEKITETWPKATVEIVTDIISFSNQAIKYQLKYSKENALSLSTDKKCNEPLNSILNVLDILEEDDRVGIFYNFMPCIQRGWRIEYQRTIDKLKNNEPIDREKLNLKYILKEGLIVLMNLIEDLLDCVGDFLGTEKKNTTPSLAEVAISSLMLEDKKKLSRATVNKKDMMVLNTQILVVSDSKDKIRQGNNAISVCESFNSISNDNSLIYKKINKKSVYHMTDFKIAGVEENTMSIDECQNFLEIPGRELLHQHKDIKKIDTLESEIPKELKNGVMSIGGNTYKGISTKAYLSNDKEFKYLTLCLIGPTRAGKTTLISNLSRDSIKGNECTILFDFCGNCDLSNDVSKAVKNVLNIDCSDFDKLQGLGYNEIKPINNNIFEIYRCAKAKTSQLMTLINSLSDDEDLRARMERYLEAAALVVFIQNGSIKDVFSILQDYKLRKTYIDNIPEVQKENLEEYILALKELDDYSKATKDHPAEIVGTKLSYAQGILNRVAKLKQNTYMELMLKKDCSNNINLVEEIQKTQLICIRMPEIMFSTEQEKDIYCTYWLTKIWGALQVRKWNIPEADQRTKVNIVFDELYQVPNCQEFLRSKLSQIAKFSCKPIISCHYLGQIAAIRNELKAANSSYMLISGCDKDNFKELKEELDPYTLEDLLNLKRYHSLNLIKYENGWSKFITKLPPPIK